MSDEMADRVAQESQSQASAPPGKSITLTITLHPNGSIDFQLPMQNKVLAYGLLETARAQLDKLYLMSEAKQAQSARGGLDGLMKRINGG